MVPKSSTALEQKHPTKDINNEQKDDFVQNQYTAFPYPPFEKKAIEDEKEWYNAQRIHYNTAIGYRDVNDETPPMQMHPTLLLEELNHYLYQGKEDFKLVLFRHYFDVLAKLMKMSSLQVTALRFNLVTKQTGEPIYIWTIVP